jgi:hypothetical protein
MAKKKKPASKTPPHPKEPAGGPFERQKAFVDERLRPLGSKRDDDDRPDTDDERGGHCGEEKHRES